MLAAAKGLAALLYSLNILPCSSRAEQRWMEEALEEGFGEKAFFWLWRQVCFLSESPEKSASETLQQVCVSLQRMWPAHPTALSGETTARAIQMFPR